MYVSVNIKECKTAQEALDTIARALNFPDYYGKNYEAWLEMMRDLEWVNSDDITIEINGWSESKIALDSNENIYFELLLHRTVNFWRNTSGTDGGVWVGFKKLRFVSCANGEWKFIK